MAGAEARKVDLLDTLDGTDRRRAAGVLLALAASLLEGDEEEVAPGEWLTLEAARERLGVKPSAGKDKNRAIKDRLRAMGVEVAKVGRALLVRRSSLDAALDKGARPMRPPPVKAEPQKTPTAADDDAARLARAGLRIVAK